MLEAAASLHEVVFHSGFAAIHSREDLNNVLAGNGLLPVFGIKVESGYCCDGLSL
jgi:hypothetical protein